MDQIEIVKNKFNERWDSYTHGYEEFTKKMEDPAYVVHGTIALSQVNRAMLTAKYIAENYDKECDIIESACGNGFLSNYLANKQYNVTAFDISQTGIKQSSALAEKLGHSHEIFNLSDHTFLGNIEENSRDIVISLGLMRYLESEVREYIYKEVYRVLRPGGTFIVSNDNQLFEIFALNDGSINFWTNVIEGYSDVKELLPGADVRQALDDNYKLPKREYAKHSASKNIERHSENPLVFADVVGNYGFTLEKIAYPDSHLLPPLLEKKVDSDALAGKKAVFCLKRAENDWRAMFMGSEFLAFLKKQGRHK